MPPPLASRCTAWFLFFTFFFAAKTSIAQQSACAGGHVSGIVKDDTDAVIPGATVQLDRQASQISNQEGRYLFPCVAPGNHTLHAEMQGFAPAEMRIKMTTAALAINMKLLVKGEDTTVEVGQNETSGIENQNASGSRTLEQKDLVQLADDPDDFKRELQILAAAGGGTPGAATISVDGFQGDAALPPKGSISFIRINPDLFSSEYGNPPYEGGRIEIYTKPGQNKLHGALFITGSPTFLNARDPFATSRAALGKRRYGFELSGGIIPNKQDFTINLEKRDINNFAVVNAYTLDGDGNQENIVSNVPQSQHLWLASARTGIQINKQNLATLSYTASVNNLENVDAGGTTLQEASYDQMQSEHNVRLSVISTISPRMVHEGRIAFTLRKSNNTPHSTAPSINVGGSFTGGGNISGPMQAHENHIEINDDVLYNIGKHNLKAGILSFNIFQRSQIPNGFNGQFYFNTLAQYHDALFGGGAAYSYTLTTGTPTINLNMSRNAVYIQDQYKLNGHMQISAGLRWAFQNDPANFQALSPRLGIAWSPDKKQKLVLRGHSGLFASPIRTEVFSDVLRLNGVRQAQSLYYGTTIAHPTGGTAIGTQRRMAANMQQPISWQNHLAAEYSFPHNWNVQANLYIVAGWNSLRTRNINQPLDNLPSGPRPGPANLNVLQYQQSGNFRGKVEFFGLDQHSFRRWQVFVGYLHMDLRSNADNPTTTPQSAYSDAGEFVRTSWQLSHRIFVIGNITLPQKIQFTTNFDTESGASYNITTGIDNNGDGNFNDRPVYVAPGTPGAINTPYGLMMNSPAGGNYIPRNLGTMPWTIHMDTNLSRAFKLSRQATEQRTVTVNLRIANLLNHTNVTTVGSVLGSSFPIGTPYAAENGRRIETGIRYSF